MPISRNRALSYSDSSVSTRPAFLAMTLWCDVVHHVIPQCLLVISSWILHTFLPLDCISKVMEGKKKKVKGNKKRFRWLPYPLSLLFSTEESEEPSTQGNLNTSNSETHESKVTGQTNQLQSNGSPPGANIYNQVRSLIINSII